MTRDLNINMEDPEEDRREEDIVAVLMTAGLKDIPAHFLPRLLPWFREETAWSMVWAGR